jgi:hypothetical protein
MSRLRQKPRRPSRRLVSALPPKAAVRHSLMACQLGSVGDVRGSRGELTRLMHRTGCAHTSGKGDGFFLEGFKPMNKPSAGFFNRSHRRPPGD